MDHSLVKYYFGSKSGLLGEVMAMQTMPGEVLARALHASPHRVAETLIANVVMAWDRPEFRRPIIAILAESLQQGEPSTVLKEYVEREVFARLAEAIGGVAASRRASAAGTVIAGLITTRYLVGIEPIASMSREDVIRTVAPVLAAALAPRRI